MKANHHMKRLIERCNFKKVSLAEPLQKILSDGLTYREGCWVLTTQLRLIQPDSRKQFEDETGYECFVNHFHLEDVISTTSVCSLLEQALVFVNSLAELKFKMAVEEPIVYIIVSDGDEVNVRFHVLRPGQTWLMNNLDVYKEAVGVIHLVDRYSAENLVDGGKTTPGMRESSGFF